MNLPAPNGWVVYIGSDGADLIPDANGYFWWADNIYIAGRKDETFRSAVMRTRNNVTEIIDLPEFTNGAITLNWSPAGLHACTSMNGVTKAFRVSQYAQFTQNVPVIQYAETTTSSVDTKARTDASQALQEALRATKIAQAAQSTANAVSTLVNALAQSRPTMDMVTGAIETRIIKFLTALNKNDRADRINAYWMDVLYTKTMDWIYIWMKDNKKL